MTPETMSGVFVGAMLPFLQPLRFGGSFPWEAMLRKQMRQRPNRRRNARGRPQIGHRL